MFGRANVIASTFMSNSGAAGRLSLPWIILCLLPGLALAAYYETEARAVTAPGFPLDDAWIHAQFARNLATGHGFSYTGDQWVAGSTAPAWTILLALGYLVMPMVTAGKVLGFMLQAATAAAAARLGGWLTESRIAAFASGALAAATPIMVWGAVSGMEVPLAAFLVTAGIYWHLRERETLAWRAAIGTGLLALSVLARPECLVLVAIAIADHGLRVLAQLRGGDSRRPRLVVLASAIALAAVVIGAWIAFNYATIGRPLPTTFYAKSGSGVMRAIDQRDGVMLRRTFEVYGPQAVTNFAIIVREQLGWAAWLAPVGLLYLIVGVRRRAAAALIALVLIGAPFAMGLTAPQRLKPSNERYAPHLIVLAAVLAAAGIAPICRAAARDRRVLAAAAVVLPAALVYSAATHPDFGAFYFTRSVKNIQELHVRLGEWIRVNIPPDAVVATNDVGAIAYFGEHRILDIEGLVSPESLAFRGQGRGLKVVEAFRPDYLAIFPHWYPEIAAQTDRFRLVHRVTIGDNYISAGGEFLVLQSPWARVPLLPPASAAPATTAPAASN